MTQQIILEIRDLQVCYGGIEAVKKINLEIRKGELVSLIGANGAGKTTSMKAITGLQKISSGEIYYLGNPIRGVSSHQLVKQGLVMVPEGRGVFARMTIVENLLMGAYLRNDKQAIKDDIDNVFTLFPRLSERAQQLAGTMSGGEQQMLAMGRALMARPKLLLLDEPSMGLSPLMVAKIFEVIQKISTDGATILLVEQNARQALRIADRGYVMDSGLIVIEGKANQLLHDSKIKEAYLGEIAS